MDHSYEVEIKSLLGSSENAKRLRERMRTLDPSLTLKDSHKQLNHYFEGGDVKKLHVVAEPHLPEEGHKVLLRRIAEEGKKHSVRTREHNDVRKLVVKSAIDDTTSANGIMRLEFEAPMPHASLQELDDLVRSAGFDYQAKWSREREEYVFRGVTVCLDRNAGYGYLAEFEKVVGSPAEAELARIELIDLMRDLGVEELPQDRLERMFAHYNQHWPEYYGTEKIFEVR